jgi:hypothetical protein
LHARWIGLTYARVRVPWTLNGDGSQSHVHQNRSCAPKEWRYIRTTCRFLTTIHAALWWTIHEYRSVLFAIRRREQWPKANISVSFQMTIQQQYMQLTCVCRAQHKWTWNAWLYFCRVALAWPLHTLENYEKKWRYRPIHRIFTI